MSDDRFYNRSEMWVCSLCGYELYATRREFEPAIGAMKLVHGHWGCERDGRQYYYPQRELTQLPEEFR